MHAATAVEPSLDETDLTSPENIVSPKEKAADAWRRPSECLHSPRGPVQLGEVPVHWRHNWQLGEGRLAELG